MMKKTAAFLCALALLPATAFAEDDITVYVNNELLSFDQPPIIYNDRTMVPMRAIFERLNLTVQWFEDEQRITAFDDDTNITMFIGEETIYINGEGSEIDVAPMIVNDRTLVPLRFIGEALNEVVNWDGDTRTVTIDIEESEYSDEDLEYRIFELTNEEREKEGLDPLVWNEDLAELARAHSLDMVERDFFSHDNPDGLSPFDRMKSAGIKYSYAAENIAAGQTSPEETIADWMNSEGHHKNILNPDLKELGVGLARGGEYGIYWTQNFATLK